MAGYLRLMRPDKVNKIHAELSKELEAKGLSVSNAQLTIDMMLIQSVQETDKAQALIQKVAELRDKCEA